MNKTTPVPFELSAKVKAMDKGAVDGLVEKAAELILRKENPLDKAKIMEGLAEQGIPQNQLDEIAAKLAKKLDDAAPRNLRGAPGTVVANKLSPEELRFAEEIVRSRGGEFVGQTTKSTPGIDGTIDGLPASLKQTTSNSPLAVLRQASVAEAKAKAAGYKGVELFIEAKNISSDVVLDFARNGGLGKIPFQGTIQRISVLTKDGWVILPGP